MLGLFSFRFLTLQADAGNVWLASLRDVSDIRCFSLTWPLVFSAGFLNLVDKASCH